MTASDSTSLPAIGFLSVSEFSDLGLIGGYLILNAMGRPVEFHCTAPVRPNRTQEILYGPTLAPYLYGEQIAVTLLEKGRSQPLFVCTNVEPVLAARNFVSLPVVWLQVPDRQPSGASEISYRVDSSHASPPPARPPRLVQFELANCRAAVLATQRIDQDQILEQWKAHAEELDLLEPFSRLHEAIEEAQRGAPR